MSGLKRAIALGGVLSAFVITPEIANTDHVPGEFYNGSASGGGSVTVAVNADGSEVDFDAEDFGGPGCVSDVSRDDIPISGHSFSLFDPNGANISISGFFPTPGRATGTVRLDGISCDTGAVTWTAATQVGWADALIRRSGRDFRGDDVYRASAAGQVRKWSARRRGKRTFLIRLEHDGTRFNDFAVKGCASSRGFKVRYFDGGGKVTGAVVNGTYETPILSPGEATSLRLVVKVTRKARIGRIKSCKVAATSSHNVDAVKAKLKARGG